MFYKNYLRIFQKRTEYLRSIDEKILSIMKNLKKIERGIMKRTKKTNQKIFHELCEVSIKNIKYNRIRNNLNYLLNC